MLPCAHFSFCALSALQGIVFDSTNCWCLSNAVSAVAALDAKYHGANSVTTLIGACNLYTGTFPSSNYSCQTVTYSSSGCTGLDGTPCTAVGA